MNTAAGGGGVRWYELRLDEESRRHVLLSAGHLRARRALSLDGRARRSTGRATSASATRSAARRTSPASASRPGWRTIPPGMLDAARNGARRRRGCADQHAALGGLRDRRRWIRATTARSGTSATTSRRTRRAIPAASDRSVCRGAGSAESDTARIRDRLFRRGGDRASSRSGSRRRTVAGSRSS